MAMGHGGKRRAGGGRLASGTGELPSPAGARLREAELPQLVHDLKSPLAAIALEAELLDARVARGEHFDAARSIGRILQNVSFLDRLIGDLQDACALAGGRLALERTHCDLRALAEAVVDRVVPVAERHRVFVKAEAPIILVADHLRIERVIANLLDNALKYTPVHGGIVVRLATDGARAQVSISDVGPGLTPDEIELVFQPYRRAESAAGRPGTGLGLFVSKQIVEAHGGHIGVESVRGFGSRFFFELPLR